MLLALIILLCLVGVAGGFYLLWKGLKRAEETDKPLERMIVRVGLSVLVVLGPAFGIWMMLRHANQVGGGMVGGFGVAFIVVGAAAVMGILLGIVWAPAFGNLIARPFVNLFLGSNEIPEAQPLYSAAEARRKQGKFEEAITEVRTQLKKFPDDTQGWMMLAEIQVENLRQFDRGAATLEAFMAREGQSPQHIILALSRLADWHLKFRHDYAAARELLERIVRQFPDLPQARAAYQRLAHLDELQQYAEDRAEAPVALPAADPRLGLRPDAAPATPPASNTDEQLAALQQHLERFPLDREAREQLALFYAHELHQPNRCAEQMEYLLGLPDAVPAEIIRWFNLLADVFIKEARDAAAARQALERLMEMLPESPAADQARQRIDRLEIELHNVAATETVKLAAADPRLGLKHDPPWRLKKKPSLPRDL